MTGCDVRPWNLTGDMNNKADRLKAALRENLKRRKAHMRDRADAKTLEHEQKPVSEPEAEKGKRKES